jgi:hypothetical protein
LGTVLGRERMCFDLEQAIARFQGMANGESVRSPGPESPAGSDTTAL